MDCYEEFVGDAKETINCWISEGRSRKVISAIIARLCFQRCANDVQNSVIIVSGRRQAKDHKKTPTIDPNSMEAHILPNLPQEIVAGNRKAIYYEGLLTAPSIGLKESIKILESNVPMHGFSILDVAIFNVCLGNDKEASKVFQLFAAYHHDLRSDDTCEMGESIENQLKAFGAEDLNCNKYGESFKFPDDGVIKTPRCVYGHDYADNLEGNCKNCRLFLIF
ncbi:BnaC01g44500D [Brassica napus]|uniref:BnaC01g44500D protein n=1 Tax=Brassica napus TaxID=3708 RepID=A0A078JET0_BRANA|nr:BnaC01g44500D [Brassica napus]